MEAAPLRAAKSPESQLGSRAKTHFPAGYESLEGKNSHYHLFMVLFIQRVKVDVQVRVGMTEKVSRKQNKNADMVNAVFIVLFFCLLPKVNNPSLLNPSYGRLSKFSLIS